MKDEIERLDDEFIARTEGRFITVEENLEYWRRFRKIQENRAKKEVEHAVNAAVEAVFKPRGVFIQNLGMGYYWLRPRSDKGLEFRLLLELEKKLLPTRKVIARLLERHKGFVIVIG